MQQKSIVKNAFFNALYKGITALFPLVTTVCVSRALLPEGVGAVSYATTVVTYFVLIASLGIPNYGIKAIAQNANDVSGRSKVFFELFIINFIATTCSIVAYYTFVNNVAHFAYRRLLFNIVGLQLILNLLNVDWFYQGIEEYRVISLRGITVRVISFLLVVLLVKKPSDYLIYALILCAGTAGNNIYNAIHLRRFIRFDRYSFDFHRHLKPVFVLLVSTIATEIYTMLDTVMLEYFHGAASVGYYSNAVKIVRMIYNLTIAIAIPFYPRLSQYLHDGERGKSNQLLSEGSKIVYLIALPAACGLSATGSMLAPVLFGEAFVPTGEVLKILGALVVVFSTAYMFGHIVLMATGQESAILRATITGAVVNFIINSLLIPKFSQNGAAVASLAAEIAVTILLVGSARKYFQLQVGRKYVFSTIVSNLCMVFCVLMTKKFLNTTVWSAILLVAEGVLVYVAVLLLTKNEAAIRLCNRITKRI